MSVGMVLLAVWLILQGLPSIVRFVIRNKLTGNSRAPCENTDLDRPIVAQRRCGQLRQA